MKKHCNFVKSLILMIISFALLSLTGIMSFAEGDILDFITYEIVNNEVTITGCDTSVSGDIIIPETIEGYPVTAIGSGAFAYCSQFDTVTIPDSVESIGTSAFYNCDYCIRVTLGSGVTSIGDYAFSNCGDMSSVVIGSNVTEMGDSLFYGTSLKNVYYYGGEDDWNNITFGSNNDKLDSVKVHYNCTADDIPEIVIVNFDGIDWIFDGDYEEYILQCFEYDIVDDEVIIKKCSDSIFGDIELPETIEGYPVTTLGSYAFEYCSDLTGIVIPSSVTTVCESAFYDCGSLESVVVYNADIEDKAFQFCDSLKDFTAYGGSINDRVFYQCTALENITLSDDVEYINVNAFNDTAYFADESNWENGALYIDNHMIYAKIDYEGVFDVKDGTVSIAYAAFESCSEITEINIPSSVKIINDTIFLGCSELEKITIDEYNSYYSSEDHVLYNKDKSELISAFGNFNSYVVSCNTKVIDQQAFGNRLDKISIYYEGSEADWNVITIGSDNASVMSAEIHYNYTDMESHYTAVITEPTCSQSGYTTYTCSCGYTYTDDYTDSTGVHNYTSNTVLPTCTQQGYTVYTCSCGYTYYSDYVQTTDHSYGNWITFLPSCTTDGEQERYCTECGVCESVTVPAYGHDYSAEWTVDTQATCTQSGIKSHHCTICNEKTDKTVIAATGHTYGEWQILTESTYTENGKQIRYCASCGISETQEIPVLEYEDKEPEEVPDTEEPTEDKEPEELPDTEEPTEDKDPEEVPDTEKPTEDKELEEVPDTEKPTEDKEPEEVPDAEEPTEDKDPEEVPDTEEPIEDKEPGEVPDVPEYILGDVNNDGIVNAADARLTLRISAKLEETDSVQFLVADVNKDEQITAADARLILRVGAKLDSFE